ncbi:hypothetical protein BC670_3440 [Flavobacterium branchiophilum]|uniref:Uncharacterized protein n=1 Tax=Flavobacterium branchiophilum TaxID=55197 RepID=A0A543G8H9_9FLAO|nr:hypothetical protein BC670_3440 [Flavobacterium branchiophilum]
MLKSASWVKKTKDIANGGYKPWVKMPKDGAQIKEMPQKKAPLEEAF